MLYGQPTCSSDTPWSRSGSSPRPRVSNGRSSLWRAGAQTWALATVAAVAFIAITKDAFLVPDSLAPQAIFRAACGGHTAAGQSRPVALTSELYRRAGSGRVFWADGVAGASRHRSRSILARAVTAFGATAIKRPLELPLEVLRLPDGFIGGQYFLLELQASGSPLNLMLDSGLTAPIMLTEAARSRLGATDAGGVGIQTSVGATGSVDMASVHVNDVTLSSSGETMQFGAMAGVVVNDFPQRKIAADVGITLDGMLGQGFLQKCDLELNPAQRQLKVYPPGGLPAIQPGWRSLPTLRLPGDLQGVLFSIPGCHEPVVAVMDTGASHTVVNARAAKVLGLDVETQGTGTAVRGIGVGGAQLEMPLIDIANASLCGAAHVAISPHRQSPGALRSWSFGNLASFATCTGSLAPATVSVGDIAFFEELLSQPQDSIGQFAGAAVLLGQDYLSRVPIRLSSTSGRVWIHES